ncbi:hypothetical protein K470DRAFT_255961 [Piedraia hortae CBS 480.64]|uniref:Uncharacterized protein n=1 Tax=Piedraia hortae CBS 480.64 TaxID=1314780 RepID=A0A6A7C502_9PEZI|nr:hypothetical protein K470DRAFT_255961 [Piedraia hortae CBS 480.64]
MPWSDEPNVYPTSEAAEPVPRRIVVDHDDDCREILQSRPDFCQCNSAPGPRNIKALSQICTMHLSSNANTINSGAPASASDAIQVTAGTLSSSIASPTEPMSKPYDSSPAVADQADSSNGQNGLSKDQIVVGKYFVSPLGCLPTIFDKVTGAVPNELL